MPESAVIGQAIAPASGARRSVAAVIALTVVAIAVTAVQSYRAIDRELTDSALSKNAAIAELAAITLAEKLDRLTDLGVSLADRVRFRELVAAGRWVEASAILGRVRTEFPVVDRITLNDTAGVLRADLPAVPEVMGRDFSDRDWYRGVSRGWQPYVSNVYRRTVGAANVFGVAVPIRNDAGAVLGSVLLQVRLETLFEWTRAVDIGPGGYLYVVDRSGRVAFHPHLPSQGDIVDFSRVAAVRQALAGGKGTQVAARSPGAEALLTAYEPVPRHRWAVIVEQPARDAFAIRDRQLGQLALAYGLTIALCALAVYLASRIAAERGRAAALRRETTELAHLNRTLRMLSDCNQALVRAASEQELLQRTCRIVTGVGGYRMAWVGLAVANEARSVTPVAVSGAEDGYLQSLNLTWHDTERGQGPAGTAIRTGAPAVARNIAGDPAFAPWREEAGARGYASAVGLPLKTESGVLGALVIYAAEPDAFSAQEMDLLTELAGDLAYGIAALRLRAAHEQAERALRASEARFHGTLDNMIEGCQIVAHDWTYLYLNDSAARHSRRAREELLGRKVTEAYPGIEDTEVFAALSDCMTRRTPRRIETEFRFPDGAQAWFDVSVHPSPEGIFIVSYEISDRRRAEDEIRALNADLERRVAERTAQLEAVNKELESFSYSVSHDLRAPLRAVLGYAGMIVEDHADRLDAEARRKLDVVQGEARRMGQLIDELLAFSRLGRRALQSGALDMTALARATYESLITHHEGAQPGFRLDELPPAWGDRVLLGQVWANLLSNAIKFSSGRQQPRIEVGAASEERGHVYFVRDNGAGFDPRYQAKLFGVFQRLHSASEFPGTGVGLALTERIVARHGGRVWAEGRPGEGATFYFMLPKEQGHEPV